MGNEKGPRSRPPKTTANKKEPGPGVHLCLTKKQCMDRSGKETEKQASQRDEKCKGWGFKKTGSKENAEQDLQSSISFSRTNHVPTGEPFSHSQHELASRDIWSVVHACFYKFTVLHKKYSFVIFGPYVR